MAINPTYPGVYVQEVPGGARAIAGVSTSTALFIGQAKEGPLVEPVLCTSYEDFVRAFGEHRSVGELATYVRLFFLNGGSRCYVMRIAKGATHAEVQLQSLEDEEVFGLQARDAGAEGERIRATVRYKGRNPESTFHLNLFKFSIDSDGAEEISDSETFKNLSMNPNSSRYFDDVLSLDSDLVVPMIDEDDEPEGRGGRSISGRPLRSEIDENDHELDTIFEGRWPTDDPDDPDEFKGAFRLAVGDAPPVEVNVEFDPDDEDEGVEDLGEFVEKIEEAFSDAPFPTQVDYEKLNVTTKEVLGGDYELIEITTDEEDKDLRVLKASDTDKDIAGPLMMGRDQGGIEVGAFADSRPAPTGAFIEPTQEGTLSDPTHGEGLFDEFGTIEVGAIEEIVIKTAVGPGSTKTVTLEKDDGDIDLIVDADDVAVWNNSENGYDGVRTTLTKIAEAINDYQQANRRDFFIKAKVDGYRLELVPTVGHSNFEASLKVLDDAGDTVLEAGRNVRHYTLGIGGDDRGFQQSGDRAEDGDVPELPQYEEAFEVADRKIDLFNLVVLPPREENNTALAELIYGTVSTLCEQQRAFLLMDPPKDWDGVQAASQGADDLRVGLVNDHAAVFYPNIRIVDGSTQREVGPAGAIAGLIARTDGSRGVWKAPAGVEAELRGVVGLSQDMSNTENGVINERGVNALRVLPAGVVNWGARTMDGDDDFASEWQYIPVRRLALHIQESLYRGLQWAVFEPNNQQLWSEIRSAVGSFMHRLYRQGAFGGESSSEAYFVKCDSSTTPPSDQALGIVNVDVGFLPVFPAEFVVLRIQQKTAEG